MIIYHCISVCSKILSDKRLGNQTVEIAPPTYSFESEPGTGIYRSGGDELAISLTGTKTWIVGSVLASITTGAPNMTAAAGTTAAPAYSFYGDTDTGMLRAAADTIAFSLGNSEKVRITSAGNVGVGTTTPYAHLSVHSTSADNSPLFVVASTTPNLVATSTAFIVTDVGNVGGFATYSSAVLC